MPAAPSRQKPVYVISGIRTPFMPSSPADPAAYSAADLAVWSAQSMWCQQARDLSDPDLLIMGCATAPPPGAPDLAQMVATRLGYRSALSAYTVMRGGGSGVQAIADLWIQIRMARCQWGLAGAADTSDRVGLWKKAAGACKQLGSAIGIRDRASLEPEIQYAEAIAHAHGMDRKALDQWAADSHRKADQARAVWAAQIAPVVTRTGQWVSVDPGIRTAVTAAALAVSPPIQEGGKVTADNWAGYADGAAWISLAHPHMLKKHRLDPLAILVDLEWASDPAAAMALLLRRYRLGWADLAAIAIQEISAAHAGGTWAQMQAPEYADLGFCDPTRINPHGGALAIGRPVAASGVQMVVHMAHLLAGHGAGAWGLVSIACRGQGGAVLMQACP